MQIHTHTKTNKQTHTNTNKYQQVDEKLAQIKDLFSREIKANLPPTDSTPAKPQTAASATTKGVKTVSGKSSPLGRVVAEDPNAVAVKLTLQQCSKIVGMVDWDRVCKCFVHVCGYTYVYKYYWNVV